MVARTRPEPAGLLLEFTRDGEEPEQRPAADGSEALLFAIDMMIRRRRLQLHDRLIVKAAAESED